MAAKSRYLRQTKGPSSRKNASPASDVARHHPRLDQRGPLPVLAEALVIDEARFGRERDLGGAGIGAQPEIGAEGVAVGGMLLQQPHELAGEAHEEGLRLDIGREPCARSVVEDDDVDVAGIVELEAAELAHGNDEIAIGGGGVGRGEELARFARLAEEEAHRLLHHRLGGDAHRGERGLASTRLGRDRQAPPEARCAA